MVSCRGLIVVGLACFNSLSAAAVTWGSPALLNSNGATDTAPESGPMFASGNGYVVAVWDSADDLGGTVGSDFDIMFARSTNSGATWTSVAPLNTSATTDSAADARPWIASD